MDNQTKADEIGKGCGNTWGEDEEMICVIYEDRNQFNELCPFCLLKAKTMLECYEEESKFLGEVFEMDITNGEYIQVRTRKEKLDSEIIKLKKILGEK